MKEDPMHNPKTAIRAGLLLVCWLSPLWAAERQYGPKREVDVQHVRIDVTPDFKQRTVTGITDIRFRPLQGALRELTLDAVHLDVNDVVSKTAIESWTADDASIVITFANALSTAEATTVRIHYQAEPRVGLYFRTPALGYKPENTHLFTQGEPHEARHWYPCYDYPNERFTSEVICRAPADMTVVSNGRRVSETIDPQSGLKVSMVPRERPCQLSDCPDRRVL